MIANRNKRELIRPANKGLVTLIFFWLLVFAFPALTCKLALSMYCEAAIQEAILRDSEKLKLESESFAFDLKIENLLQEVLSDVKKSLLAETETLVGNTELASLSQQITRRCLDRHQPAPLLCAVYNRQTGKAETFNQPGSIIKPGKRSIEIMLSHLSKSPDSFNETQKKRYHQIVSSVFGNLINLPERPGLIKSGFFAQNNADRLFIYYDLLPGAGKTPGLTIFLVFSENSIGLRHLLKHACQRRAFPGTRRSFALLKTAPDRDFMLNRNGRLFFAAPVNSATLRVGSHAGKSWYDRVINDGSARQKPSMLPFTIVSTDSGRLAVPLVRYLPFLNIAMTAFLFLGLVIVRQALAGNFVVSTLQQRFKFAILFATVLPFAAFIGTSHQFTRHFNKVMITSQIQNISNDVRILEMNILNNDLRERQSTSNFAAFLNKNKTLSEKALSDILDQKIGQLYEGYALLRSDGLYLEKLPDKTIASIEDYNKLIVAKEIYFSQFYNVFSLASALKPDFASKAAKYQDFIKWKAFSVHLTEVDRDSFCQQDGDYSMTRNAEKTYYRLSVHNLFPESDKTELWAGLMLIKNARATVEKFLQSQSNNSSLAIKRNGDAITHCAVFRCHEEPAGEIDLSFAWPKSALNDTEMVAAARRMHGQQREASWTSVDSHGMATLFSARALPGLPFILVAKTMVSNTAVHAELFWVVLICLLLYSMLLIAVLSTTLSEIFLKPINLLLTGINMLEHGNYPILQHSSTNELGKLIEQFNSMADGMRQRQLLERFISDELSQTITEKTQQLQDHSAALVYRVVFFIHITEFSRICEHKSPEHAILLLSHYFTALEPQIRRYSGQIDKYIGDAIMVSFSRERTANRPEEAAAKAALACKSSLPGLNKALEIAGLPKISIGIGIACGMVIMGEVGARKSRRDFTLIGDPVNLAARLEANSHFDEDSHILVTDAIAREVNPPITANFYREILVKGKSAPVKTYELAGVDNDQY